MLDALLDVSYDHSKAYAEQRQKHSEQTHLGTYPGAFTMIECQPVRCQLLVATNALAITGCEHSTVLKHGGKSLLHCCKVRGLTC